MKPHIEEAWRSLRMADRDIMAFNILAGESAIHVSIVCFHAQQSVEKALKAVLFSRQIEFRRTHNLTDLTQLLRQNGVETPVADDALRQLNPFAVILRYDNIEIELLSYNDTANWVTDIRRWAEEQIRTATENAG